MDYETILKVFEFAYLKHDGQVRRKTKEPYITHPLNVAFIVSSISRGSSFINQLVSASLLHDVPEDTATSIDDLKKEFDNLTVSLVIELTNDDEEISKIGKHEYMKIKLIGLSSFGLRLKLADRLANIQDFPTKTYVVNTLDLMDFLKTNRKLTPKQLILVELIEHACNDFLK
jgi:(p)ppGpp synthase/HD superfamily hydrolase